MKYTPQDFSRGLMKLTLLTLLLSFSAFAGSSQIEVIYGVDNRKDLFEVTQSLHKKLAASTAGMVDMAFFEKGSAPATFNFRIKRSLEKAHNLCPNEKFARQLVGPQCSGFLVGPDTLVTAGHCYYNNSKPEEVCKNFVWLFDYALKTYSTDPSVGIPRDNLYLCKKVVYAASVVGRDYAIIKLDRPVVGRAPLKFRDSGSINKGTSLVVIGHPSGLPQKITDGAKVLDTKNHQIFSANIDTFQGNSGSAVFDASTGQVEGILVMGKTDYVLSNAKDKKSCRVVNKCDDDTMNCSAGKEEGEIEKGEIVFRITNISSLIKKALLKK